MSRLVAFLSKCQGGQCGVPVLLARTPVIAALALALCLPNEGAVMRTNKTSIAATLQKLIDHGVDMVCADYDGGRSIKTRALAVMNSGERRTIELTFSRKVLEMRALLDEADKGARGRVKIIYLLGGEIDIVFISAARGGWKAQCLLIVHRKTGKSDNDIALVTELADDSDFKIPYCFPSKWAGPVVTAKLCVVPE